MMNISQMLGSLAGHHAPTVAAEKPFPIDISGAIPVPTGVPNLDPSTVLKGNGGGNSSGGGDWLHLGDLFNVFKNLPPSPTPTLDDIKKFMDGIFHHS